MLLHMQRTRIGSRGVTLIDTVVGSALILTVFLGVAAVFQLSIDVVTNNRARAGAIALANERMEYIRSLDYSSIGTVGGIPAGSIAQSETVMLSNISYTRRTTIEYADDSGDGVAPTDTVPVDYKAVRVDTSWSSRLGERHITLVSRVQPPNGLEVACASPCGTLALSVVDASSLPVSGAQVRIVNASTTPATDILTFTNASGTVMILGAPVATGYQISVSKTGYNSAQTHSSSAQNPNPTLGHLTVVQNQTASATFGIDALSSKTVYTYIRTAETWQDTFVDSAKIGTSTNVDITGGDIRTNSASDGTLYSTAIAPTGVTMWDTLSWNDTEPAGTSVKYRMYYPSGSAYALIPDSVLAGNSGGFTTSPVAISSISTTDYPSLVLGAVLDPQSPGVPSIQDWSLSYTQAQPLGSFSFNMRGAKVIGSGPTVYKYNATSTTGSVGYLTLSSLEWDTYTTSVVGSGYDIASSCAPQPEYLAPGSSLVTHLYMVAHTTRSLRFEIKSSTSSAPVAGATVGLSRAGYSATSTSDTCGQSMFSGLSAVSHTYSISRSGFQTYNGSISPSGNDVVQITLIGL